VAFVLDRQPRAETLTVECVKTRAMLEPLPFTVSWWWSPEGRSIRFGLAEKPTEEKVARRRRQKLPFACTVLLSAFGPGEELPTGTLLREAEERGVKRRTAERALGRLECSGRLTKLRRGRWRLAEPAG
jgi:hypothetical protein